MWPSFVQLSSGEMGKGKEGKIGFLSSLMWSGKEGVRIYLLHYIKLELNSLPALLDRYSVLFYQIKV